MSKSDPRLSEADPEPCIAEMAHAYLNETNPYSGMILLNVMDTRWSRDERITAIWQAKQVRKMCQMKDVGPDYLHPERST